LFIRSFAFSSKNQPVVARRINPTLEDSILNLVSWSLHIPKTSINAFSHLRDDLNLDSIDCLLLIATLERQFDVYFSAEEAEAIETVRDAIVLIQKRIL